MDTSRHHRIDISNRLSNGVRSPKQCFTMMAGDRSPNRDRVRRRETREHDKNRHDKNRDRHGDRSRNDKPRKRDRSRSRSRNRDDERPQKSNHQSREHNHRSRDDHSRKFDFSNTKVKKEPSPEWGKRVPKEEKDKNPVEKEKPNFALSGKLTEDRNAVNGVVIKYSEPGDARKPKRRWRLYPYKGEKELPIIHIHRQSAYLMGRDRTVADIPLDHPSCSKQHAALQFRLVPFKRQDGSTGKCVKPYLIDLESANGTLVNDVKLEARRYHELFERDVLKFGFSSREYVVLHENSKDDAMDDDFIASNEI